MQEKDIVLSMALDIGKQLTDKYECLVLYTRTDDIFVDKRMRAKMANNLGADLFVSFHINSHITTAAQGYEDFVRANATRQTLEMRAQIHDKVHRVWVKYKRRNRGQKIANFAVLRHTRMPAVLVENGFIRNVKDAALLQNSIFMNELNNAHIEGIAQAMSLPLKIPRTYIVAAGDTLWSIASSQLGNGTRWVEIAALNSLNLSTHILHIGQVLMLP